MKKTNKINDVSYCTGCSACSYICNQRAIQMSINKEGFLYPTVNDQCVECGLCIKACPLSDPETLRKRVLKSIGGYTTIPEIYCNSSSGGVFAAIAYDFINNGGIYTNTESCIQKRKN